MRWRAGHPRWLIIGLVFLATTINSLDRQTLSVLAPALIDQFHMSNEAYARVISAFMLAYTVMNGVSGPLIDRLGTRPRSVQSFRNFHVPCMYQRRIQHASPVNGVVSPVCQH